MSTEPDPERTPLDTFDTYRIDYRIRSLEAKLRLLSGAALGLAALVGALSLTTASASRSVPTALSAGETFLVHDGIVVGRWVAGAGQAVRFEALGRDGSVVSAVEVVPQTPLAGALAGRIDGLPLGAAN